MLYKMCKVIDLGFLADIEVHVIGHMVHMLMFIVKMLTQNKYVV